MNENSIDPVVLLLVLQYRQLRRAIDAANRVNQRVADFLAGEKSGCRRHPDNGGTCRFHAWPGNCDSWHGDVVQPGELPAGGDGRDASSDGERKATGRHGDDLRDVEAREAVRATLSGDELREWQERNSPLDGPRPREGVAFGWDGY